MKIVYLLLLHFAICSYVSYAQSNTENYVLSRNYKTAGATVTIPDKTKYAGNPDQVQTQVTYLDGLGKTSQTVLVSGNTAYKDMVSRVEYNSVYLQSKEFLPVAVNSADGRYVSGASGAFYNSSAVGDPTENFWTETIYDNSPLGRVSEQKAPGVSTGIKKEYHTNQVGLHGDIKWYKFNGTGDLVQTEYYPDNSLNVNKILDEDGKKVEEFTDRYGRVVLKRTAGQEYTYYVYNSKGQLRYVLQPEYDAGTASQADKLSRYAFQYTYDAQGRMMTKKVPGQDTFTMEYYDTNDMLHYMTDGRGQKFYYKYDGFNRQTEMGIVLGGNENALLYTYYDDYSYGPFQNFDNSDFSLTDNDHFVNNPQVTSSKGLVTGTNARVLKDDGTLDTKWLKTVTYYDRKGRVIQIHRQLFGLGENAVERVSYKLDFAGNITHERTTQLTSSIQYRLDKTFTYDQQNRLLSTTHIFFEDNVEKKAYTHVANTYNEVGMNAGKKFHNNVQEIGYKYTARGWLYTTKNNEGKTFEINLRYNSNGNISSLSWQTQGNTGNFNPISYDDSNRLTSANGSPNQENGITYDKNGNIKTLNRTGAVTDNLTYNYTIPSTTNTSNRLVSVTDGSGNENGVKTGTSSFAYDQNGNMTSDGTKGATVTYNPLNLPAQVALTGRTVKYVYDAGGAKLQMTSPAAGTLYAGAFEYTLSGTLLRVGLEEGQLIRSSAGVYEANYYFRDHLGNVRQVLKEDGTVLQETEYYAFGLPVTKTGNDVTNKYLYNGKEKQPETGWLDYGARMYMAEIGRWGGGDPLTDEQEAWSPYHYAYNSPVNYVDLYGLSPASALGGNAIAICPTCPSDKKYDEYRDSKSLYTYDKSSGMVLNGDGKGATVYGQRNQESTFSGWEHAIGLGVGLPAVEIPKKWLGKATVGDASKVTTPISYLSNKLAESQRLQKLLRYKNVMSKRLFTHTRMINGQMVRLRTNLVGRYVGRWLGFGLARASMAITVYDIVDTANTNFQNMSLADQNRLLQTGQMSGSFIPNELIQQQQENVKSHFDNE
ncbi:hypothetical protein DYBT9275_03130 [Dyadobacter sp. CECT 9275]|uniref:DUF6443 domain-containing protein n=1 Tax=Dyadobacter helix TaxID=2822344 RepID=A0A916NCB0_9BACT|nr:DUF6443 domain-containing protein [Dyadobacter sp. CECT 9275]CAG5003337.1 hypothetical protein DYBT9275_03130 [Dyadobacter sp. CECT 9275]